ncbi:MAG TPA: M1 family aminopeptidase [Terracidiphilus sp.]|nr:M1 family aminopeptidase [Terracidiphilus sp.]
MPIPVRASFAVLAFFIVSCAAMLDAQHPGNSNTYYQQLRGLLPGGEVIQVNNLELRRDAATFTFRHGSFTFYGEVNGKVTGAVFKGEGHLHITPPTAEERHNLSVVMHTEEFDEDFDQMVLRFTDGTAAELHKGLGGKGDADSGLIKAAQEFQSFARQHLHDNFDLRLLQDVLSPVAGGYFMAAMHGHKAPHLLFILDPQGAGDVAPEEVELMNWNDWGPSFPLAFHRAGEYVNGTANGNELNASYRILSEGLDVSIEKNGFLSGIATVELRAEQDSVAVVPLDLYPTLRVSRAETEKGDPLDFVQEKKEDDPDFGVVLAKTLKKGESATVRITYAGKDVVKNEGGANYYPVARESWYPNASSGLGNYATYRMSFHVPKGLQLIATGTKENESTEGKVTTTEWKTDVPLAVVGFNLGSFTMKEAKVEGKLGDDLTIDAYANTTPPDDMAQMQGGVLGTLSTTSMLAGQLSQGEVAARIYTNYFGPLPFARVAITQQYACNYGQSWPMLVYLPICGFLDTTQQHFMGLHPEDMYWKVVTPHEVAHQWWGQTVGFRSYRDQWMSEGFANTSAAIFLQLTRPKPDEFREFWKQQRKLITEKNAQGFRPIDVGPVTMGFRLSTEKTGWDIYQNLVYPKGAYILHMIRMMMWSPKEGDGRFMDTMHDFLSTYRLQAATTEDFKAMVEKHMSQQMDLDRNHRMDWFFSQYVYGTDLPNYHFESDVTQNGDITSLHYKLTQSGVGESFKMLVPIYVETADGKFLRLGSTTIHGSKTVDQTLQLPKFPSPVKRALIDYNYDVLSTVN